MYAKKISIKNDILYNVVSWVSYHLNGLIPPSLFSLKLLYKKHLIYKRALFCEKKWKWYEAILRPLFGSLKLMQHIDSSDFSELQKEIIQMRVEGSSLSQIIQRFNTKYGATKGKLTKQALIHCLEKSAIALKWDKGMKGEVITTSLAPILPFLKRKSFKVT